MLNKSRIILIIPTISLLMLIGDQITKGFISFYVSLHVILLINIAVVAILVYKNEEAITKSVQRFKLTPNLIFLSKFTFITGGITLAIRFLQPIIYSLADKFSYYGYFYRLYNRYYLSVESLEEEFIFLVVISLAFIALARKKSIKPNNSDVNIAENKLSDQRAKRFKGTSFTTRIKRLLHREGLFYSVILGSLSLLFIIFGVIHLGNFMTVDEPKWFEERVPNFYEALVEEDWAGTYTNDKPGILPSLFSNTVNLFIDRATLTPSTMVAYLFWWRLPLVLLGALFLFPIYHFTKKLFNKDTAIISTSLIALSPTIIGMSQVVNPDATLWSTAFLTFITFMLYMKTNKQKYIIYSGLLFGLALISKYFISIFYILYFAVIYLEYLTKHKDYRVAIQRYVDLGKLVFISIIIYAAFFPATWFNYRQIIAGTLGSEVIRTGFPVIVSIIGLTVGELVILNGKVSTWLATKLNLSRIISLTFVIGVVGIFTALGINTIKNYSYFDLDSFLWVEFQRRSADIIKTFASSLYTTFFVLTLPTIAGIIVTFWMIIKKKVGEIEGLTINSSLVIILLFIAGSAIGGFVATARYQIMLIPLYILIASIGLSKVGYVKTWIIAIFIASILTLWSASPFYLTYENGLNKNSIVINDPWGMGAYELAQEMNKLPDAENIKVWSDREGFNEFFIGKTYWRGTDNPFDKNLKIDYLILSIGGERIYNVALQKYKTDGEGDLYSRMALQTPLLQYYEKKADYIFCLDDNRTNCVKAVKVVDIIDY